MIGVDCHTMRSEFRSHTRMVVMQIKITLSRENFASENRPAIVQSAGSRKKGNALKTGSGKTRATTRPNSSR